MPEKPDLTVISAQRALERFDDDKRFVMRCNRVRPLWLWQHYVDAVSDVRALAAELARLHADLARYHDLVRHQRTELHEAGLLTDAEYAALAEDGGSVSRLESYDRLRDDLARLRERVAPLDRYERELVLINCTDCPDREKCDGCALHTTRLRVDAADRAAKEPR